MSTFKSKLIQVVRVSQTIYFIFVGLYTMRTMSTRDLALYIERDNYTKWLLVLINRFLSVLLVSPLRPRYSYVLQQ